MSGISGLARQVGLFGKKKKTVKGRKIDLHMGEKKDARNITEMVRHVPNCDEGERVGARGGMGGGGGGGGGDWRGGKSTKGSGNTGGVAPSQS